MKLFQMAMCACALSVSAAADAASVDVHFSRISSNASENVESQFVTTVSTVSGDSGVVDFVFRNNVGTKSCISEIYFDNGAVSSLFSAGSINAQVGASFNYGTAAPPDLPGGDSMSEPFQVTGNFKADAQGNPSAGINTASDSVSFRMTLLAGVSFNDVIAALASGELRLGMHVRSIGANEQSDAFVNDAPPPPLTAVPTPSPAFLGAAGLGLLAGRRRR